MSYEDNGPSNIKLISEKFCRIIISFYFLSLSINYFLYSDISKIVNLGTLSVITSHENITYFVATIFLIILIASLLLILDVLSAFAAIIITPITLSLFLIAIEKKSPLNIHTILFFFNTYLLCIYKGSYKSMFNSKKKYFK